MGHKHQGFCGERRQEMHIPCALTENGCNYAPECLTLPCPACTLLSRDFCTWEPYFSHTLLSSGTKVLEQLSHSFQVRTFCLQTTHKCSAWQLGCLELLRCCWLNHKTFQPLQDQPSWGCHNPPFQSSWNKVPTAHFLSWKFQQGHRSVQVVTQ